MAVEQEVKRLCEEAVEAFNNHDPDRFLSYCSNNAVYRDVSQQEIVHNLQSLKEILSSYWSACPDVRASIESLIVDKERACLQARLRGTQRGKLATVVGKIDPTGLQIDLPTCLVLRVEDGKIREAVQYYDALSLLRQLGALSLLAKAA